MTTVADAIAATLDAYGVRHIFGVPGGGSNLEIIAACEARGITWILTHTETAAALMAAATGELTGTPGVVATGLGPGATSAVNGIAYAHLDRAPVLLLTDAYRPETHDFITHQKVDHAALYAPIVKASDRARPDDVSDVLARLLDRALTAPLGPVHLDLSAIDAGKPAVAPATSVKKAAPALAGDVAAARALIDDARRPVIIAGIQARDNQAAAALAALADHLACPVMTTYKAKGVYSDGAPRHAGLFTGAKTEAPWLADADLMILYGVDPVELVASPWPYEMPVLELAQAEVRPHYTAIAGSLFGALPALAEAVAGAGQPANWSDAPAPQVLPDGEAEDGISPLAVVRVAIEAAPETARITIDAGAHMLAPMALWPAKQPFDVQISNGLSTMGFALPAAIAAALADPKRPVIAFTGDGGLAMCLAELATLARHDLDVTVVVFNDAALSLIDVKQQQRGFKSAGVRYPALDLALIAVGADLHAARAETEAELRAALMRAFATPGPALIDARVDPSGYRAMFEAIRGGPTQATQT